MIKVICLRNSMIACILLVWSVSNPLVAQLVRKDTVTESSIIIENSKQTKPFIAPKWRVGFDPTSLLGGYKHLRTSVTVQYKERRFFNVNLNYGWNGLTPTFPNSSGDIFQNGYSSYGIDLQVFKSLDKKKNKDAYLGIGSLFRKIEGTLRNGYFRSDRNNETKIFERARIDFTQFGILSTAGVVLTRGIVNLDLRFELPLIFSVNKFSALEDPITINSFAPGVARHYQKDGVVFRSYPILALFIGIKG